MSQTGVFGTACKTCRRRGRKCDRSLPTCKSCSERGVKCEGYVLRWVGVAARGPLAGQTYPATNQGVDLRLTENSQAKAIANAKSPETHTHVAEDPSPGPHKESSQAITTLRQQNWDISSVVEMSGDNLEGLVEYCTRSPKMECSLSATNHVLDGRELGSAFYLGRDPAETPYARHILPMIRSMPSLKCAVAALASCHLANRLDDNSLKIQSLHLRLKATELLREDLKSSSNGPGLGCLACMLLLAQLDVSWHRRSIYNTYLIAAGVMLWGLYRIWNPS
jgi:hypothetical protein